MNPLKKAYCRVFQNVFKFALPLLPYRNPKIIGSVKGIPEVLEKETITMYSSSQMQGSEALALQKGWSRH